MARKCIEEEIVLDRQKALRYHNTMIVFMEVINVVC